MNGTPKNKFKKNSRTLNCVSSCIFVCCNLLGASSAVSFISAAILSCLSLCHVKFYLSFSLCVAGLDWTVVYAVQHCPFTALGGIAAFGVYLSACCRNAMNAEQVKLAPSLRATSFWQQWLFESSPSEGREVRGPRCGPVASRTFVLSWWKFLIFALHRALQIWFLQLASVNNSKNQFNRPFGTIKVCLVPLQAIQYISRSSTPINVVSFSLFFWMNSFASHSHIIPDWVEIVRSSPFALWKQCCTC